MTLIFYIVNIITLLVWLATTGQVLLHLFLGNEYDETPWPLAPDKPEPRSHKWFKVWAYTPTIFAAFGWNLFKVSSEGSRFLKWMKEKV